jgi:hypothetical protein
VTYNGDLLYMKHLEHACVNEFYKSILMDKRPRNCGLLIRFSKADLDFNVFANRFDCPSYIRTLKSLNRRGAIFQTQFNAMIFLAEKKGGNRMPGLGRYRRSRVDQVKVKLDTCLRTGDWRTYLRICHLKLAINTGRDNILIAPGSEEAILKKSCYIEDTKRQTPIIIDHGDHTTVRIRGKIGDDCNQPKGVPESSRSSQNKGVSLETKKYLAGLVRDHKDHLEKFQLEVHALLDISPKHRRKRLKCTLGVLLTALKPLVCGFLKRVKWKNLNKTETFTRIMRYCKVEMLPIHYTNFFSLCGQELVVFIQM